MGVELYDSLDGQIALVTGANRGIGEAVAAQLEELGATVYAGARNPDDVDAPGQRPVELDVTEQDQIAAAIDRIDEEEGRLDVLVNNAGVYAPTDDLEEVPPDHIETVYEVNLTGPTLVCREALPLLTEQEGARVVNVSSAVGQFAEGGNNPNNPLFSSSKAGLNRLTKALLKQYPDLVANAGNPGWTQTRQGGPNAPQTPEEAAETLVWLARFKPDSPSGLLWHDKETVDW